MKKSLLVILIIAMFIGVVGCKTNPAADRFVNFVHKYEVQFVLENENLSDGEKEITIFQMLQGLQWEDKKIAEYIKALREQYGWNNQTQPVEE